MATILVTGGTGFIGSHTVVALQQQGYEVIILDNFVNSDKKIGHTIAQITGIRPVCIQGSICERSMVDDIFVQYSIDAVVHCAGLKAVGESCKDPFLYRRENIGGTMTLLEAMDAAEVRTMIFSSSATVYDVSREQAPFTESMRTGHTTNPYGTTKHVIEQLLADMVQRKRMRITSLRYFNPIGAHSSGLLGENPTGTPNNLFPLIMEILEGKREKLQVYGDTYDTPDGSGVRDYMHIEDLADAHVVVLDEVLQNDALYRIYNVGTGRGTSVLEMVAWVEKTLALPVAYDIVGPRHGDIATSVADVTHIQQSLGRKAKRTIVQAIQDGWKWRLSQ